ncbi:hypothetical protein [Streptomyces sp. WMMC905]|uniref:hypothetical protein n=1 Tax=Streptomyces sp. WMMC905 TaxID=3404123 RepID=UPI003B9237B2
MIKRIQARVRHQRLMAVGRSVLSPRSESQLSDLSDAVTAQLAARFAALAFARFRLQVDDDAEATRYLAAAMAARHHRV